MKRLIEVIGLAPSENELYYQRLQYERERISKHLAAGLNAQRQVTRTVAPKVSKKAVMSELQREMERLGIKSMEELKTLLGGTNGA